MGCMGGSVSTPEPTSSQLHMEGELMNLLKYGGETTPGQSLLDSLSQAVLMEQLKDMGYTAEMIETPGEKTENPAWSYWATGLARYNEPERWLYGPTQYEWELNKLPGESPYEQRTAQQQELASMQLEYAKQQLEWLKDAREMGEITGDLTAEELALFDEMEANSVQTLTEAVNTQHRDIANSAIADLVARGVWQGDIGAHAMSDISEKAMEQIATGAREISTTKNANILNAMENKKNRQLQEILAAQGNATGTWNASQAAQQAGLQMANQATQYGAGLKAQWDATKMGGVSNMMNYYGQQAQNALNASIANSQNKASMLGSIMGAVGNIAGLAGLGWMSKK